MATFIDPRFKTKYMNTEESTDVKEKLIHEVSSITTEAQLAEETNQSNTDSLLPPKKKKKTLGTLFKDNEQEDEQMPVISVQQCIMSELQTYSTTSKIDFEEDPLKRWKFHSAEYPCLSKLAKKYLCVCATISPSKRLFSTSGNIVSPNRCSMKPDTVEMLTFLSRNLNLISLRLIAYPLCIKHYKFI